MTLQPTPPPPPDSLRDVLEREFAAERAAVQRPSRLDPIPLPPPPGQDTGTDADLLDAAEDIAFDFEAERERRRQIIIAAGGIGLALLVGLSGWLVYSLLGPPPAPPPIVRAEPEGSLKAPAPSVETDTRSASEGESELRAPDTTGLSPARRIPTQRIIVDNDREVTPR